MKKRIGLLILAVGLILGAAACSAPETGTVAFRANGEDFVRQGFVSRDGWAITFDQVSISVSDITAYQTAPPYDAHAGGAINGKVKASLEGVYTVDLAEGGADADPILLGEAADAPVGQYNALEWQMVAGQGGYPLFVVGQAEKDGLVVPFQLSLGAAFHYTCGEYVGDIRRGFLQTDGRTELEMTFHFDHIFGDAGTPLTDDLNQMAVGFGPFAALANGGSLQADMASLSGGLSADDYEKLVVALESLGHVGEGHCYSEEN